MANLGRLRNLLACIALVPLFSACGPANAGGKGGTLPKPIEVAKESPGSVLEHMPKTCGAGRGYISAKAIHRNAALSSAWGSIEDRAINGAPSSKHDMAELQRMLKTLKEGGLSLARDLDDIAFCMPARKEPVVAIGGAFGDKDVLPTLQGALRALGEDWTLDPSPSGSNGVGSVLHGTKKHDPVLGHVARNVLVGALSRQVVDALTPVVDRSADWGVTEDDVLVINIPGDKWSPKIDARLKLVGETATLSVVMDLKKGDEEEMKDPKEFEKKIRGEMDSVAAKMAKGPLAPLVDAVRSTKIAVEGKRVTFSAQVSSNQLVSALSGMNLDDMDRWF